MLFRGAILIQFDPPGIQRADFRVEEGRFAEVGGTIAPRLGEPIHRLKGAYVLPGFVLVRYSADCPANSSRHLATALNSPDSLDTIKESTFLAAREAALFGVTTIANVLFERDDPGSPDAPERGARDWLDAFCAAQKSAGLRGILANADENSAECALPLRPAASLSAEEIESSARAGCRFVLCFPEDALHSRQRSSAAAGAKTCASSSAETRAATFFNLLDSGAPLLFGSKGQMPPDVPGMVQLLYYMDSASETPQRLLRPIAEAARFASRSLGISLGRIEPGAAADFLIAEREYRPTPPGPRFPARPRRESLQEDLPSEPPGNSQDKSLDESPEAVLRILLQWEPRRIREVWVDSRPVVLEGRLIRARP